MPAVEQRWWVRERRTGQVYRTITLPNEVDAERASCSYHDGLLEITLPKGAPERRHRIPVRGSRADSAVASIRPRKPRWLQRFAVRGRRKGS